MEKHRKLEDEILHNLNKKKFYFLLVIILILISGFLLFNQITYLNAAYDNKRNNYQKERVLFYIYYFRIHLFHNLMCLHWNNLLALKIILILFIYNK